MNKDKVHGVNLYRGVCVFFVAAAVMTPMVGCKSTPPDNPPPPTVMPPANGKAKPGGLAQGAPGKLPPPPGFHAP
jgi:hypothetical protein